MEIALPATIENIEKVIEFINDKLDNMNCPTKKKTEIDIAIDEIYSNIAKYAYEGKKGTVTVKIERACDSQMVAITFIDDGKPYNPLANEDPNVKLSADEREIGGLGIYMVKKSMDIVNYEYRDNKNVLQIKKNIN